uniref:Uncharacterized protein n=1 Tax=Lepeophtheirus salmonis TaxID=72036 RepID=A0A0K2UY47_LEPSM
MIEYLFTTGKRVSSLKKNKTHLKGTSAHVGQRTSPVSK